MNRPAFALILSIIIFNGCANSNKEKLPNPVLLKTVVDTTKPEETPATIPHKKDLLKDNDLLKESIVKDQLVRAYSINLIIDSISGLEGYKAFTYYKSFVLKGDFYGDGIDDLALLIEKDDKVNLCIINYTDTMSYYVFGDKDNYDDYGWAGVFEKVNAGETLWSNYIDDFRSLEDVPDNEKVVLDYDAIYAHASESCGGGFIFWKDGKFNWLQQE